MTTSIDISDDFHLVEDLPQPRWDSICAKVELVSPETDYEVWTNIAAQWLERLCAALQDRYVVVETVSFLLLLDGSEHATDTVGRFAEGCRTALLKMLADVVDFASPGKIVILQFQNSDTYYQYVSAFHPEGRFGGSAGMQIRQGYPHVVVYGSVSFLQPTVAHELMHAALSGLTLPLWIEEGLTQMFEHDMTGTQPLLVNGEMARRHKKYWSRHGLTDFWSGKGFQRAGRIQELSYQLAEILMRLLIEKHRPGWFGRGRAKQERLFTFLRQAKSTDCGAAASSEHLGRSLCDLAATFLGPGDWSPLLPVSETVEADHA